MAYGYGSQPGYNPYASNSDMMRQQPQQFIMPGVYGRVIQAPTDIMPGDIPMNGTPCFFPMQDGSAIYMKAWQANGTISTMRFLPEHAAPKEPTQLDRIENMLKRYFEEQSLPPVKIEVGNE